MLGVLFIFIPFLLIACSKDKPAPVAPAGKATDGDCAFCDLFDAFNAQDDDDGQDEQTPAESDSPATESAQDDGQGEQANAAPDSTATSDDTDVEEESAEPIGDFNIELVFFDGPKYPFTAEEKRLIRNAADFWERVIGGDVPDYTLTEEDRELLAGLGAAGTGYASIGYSNAFDTPAHIDDLRIYVSRDDGDYNYIPPCNGLNLRAFGLSSIGKIEVNYLLNEYGYFGSSTARRSPDIYWSEDRFLWQTAHEIGHAILGHPEEDNPSLYYWEREKTSRVKRERPKLIGIYFAGQQAGQAYEAITGISNLKGIDIKLWFKGMGPPGFHGYTLQEMIWRWPPARFHWPFHQALENSLMAHRTPQDMPLDAPLEISQVTRGALIDLGYQVEDMSIP